MNEAQRGVIRAVPAGVERPLWSVMIPTYNCAGYLRETLASVLGQDPGPERMQIEVVDDHSTRDDPEAVVRELGKGRVGFFRQPRNVGHVENFNTCLERARGELIHLLHGDDRVRDGFYRTMEVPFQEYPQIGAAFCRYIAMDEQGHWRHVSDLLQRQRGMLADSLKVIASELPVTTSSFVVRRGVFEQLGGFDRRFRFYGKDVEMWVRVAAHHPIAYEPEPLVICCERVWSGSGMPMRMGQYVRDAVDAADAVVAYLPPEIAEYASPRSKQRIALEAVGFANGLIQQGDLAGARAQLREALRCSRAWPVLLGAGRSMYKMLRRSRDAAVHRNPAGSASEIAARDSVE